MVLEVSPAWQQEINGEVIVHLMNENTGSSNNEKFVFEGRMIHVVVEHCEIKFAHVNRSIICIE